jgi:hypothetical protein
MVLIYSKHVLATNDFSSQVENLVAKQVPPTLDYLHQHGITHGGKLALLRLAFTLPIHSRSPHRQPGSQNSNRTLTKWRGTFAWAASSRDWCCQREKIVDQTAIRELCDQHHITTLSMYNATGEDPPKRWEPTWRVMEELYIHHLFKSLG